MTLLKKIADNWRRRRHNPRHTYDDAWLSSLDWTTDDDTLDTARLDTLRLVRPAIPPKEIH